MFGGEDGKTYTMKILLTIFFGLLLGVATSGSPIAEIWKRIELARKAKVRKPTKLYFAASKDEVDKLEKHLGCELPQQLRASLLLHRGMEGRWGLEIIDRDDVSQAYRWLGVDGIRNQWDQDRKEQKVLEAEGDKFEGDPKWIPIFACPGAGEQIIYLDSTDGTVMLRGTMSTPEFYKHRYKDLRSFLEVLEKSILNQLWFEWGCDAEG